MAKNFKIADIEPETVYSVSLIDNWDGSTEHRTMSGTELISFTNAAAHLCDIHAEKTEEERTEMTYSHYIRKNKLKDSKETYVEYLEKHHTLYKMQNPGMKKQFVEMNYKFRFC